MSGSMQEGLSQESKKVQTVNNILSDLLKNRAAPAKEVTAKVFTESSIKSSGIESVMKSSVDEIEKKVIQGKPVYISVEYGGSFNMGNYNQAKVKVGISYPVGQEITEDMRRQIDVGYEFARQFVEQRFKAEVEQLKK